MNSVRRMITLPKEPKIKFAIMQVRGSVAPGLQGLYIGYTQKNGAVSKVKKNSHLTRAQNTPSAAATVQVSHVLPAGRFSCLLRGPVAPQ
jgi:hypothetical protein